MKNRALVLALVGIAIVAGSYLRLADMELMEFKEDEGRVLVIVWKWVSQGVFPQKGGITSVGSYFCPLFSYFLSFSYAIYPDPVWVTACIALFNVLGLFICYLMVRRFWGERVAVVSVILFAVSPWAVLYSRKIWNPNLCPPFTIIFFYSLLSIIIDRKVGYVFPLILSWLILVQLHPVCIVLGVVPVVTFIIYRPKWRWSHLVAGLVIGLVPLLAFLRFMWIRRIDLIQRAYEWSSTRESGSVIPIGPSLVKAWKIPFMSNLSFFNFEMFVGNSAWASLIHDRFSIYLNSSEHVLVVLGLLFVVGEVLGRKGRGAEGRGLEPRGVILLLWFLAPSIIFGLLRIPLASHYFILLYPCQFILIGLAYDRLWSIFSRGTSLRLLLRGALVLLVSGIAVSQFLFMCRFYRLIEKDGGAAGDYGTAYIHKKRAGDFILNRSRSEPFAVYHDFGSAPSIAREYLFLFPELADEKRFAGDGRDRYVVWDPYYRGNLGRYPSSIPPGWKELNRIGPLRVFWRSEAE